MKVNIYSQKGEKKTKKIEVSDEIFGSKVNISLIDQYIYIHIANCKQGTHSAKDRSEVSGTGRKPWANNKVEKARAGDLKSNIFRHGGVSHGPQPSNVNLSMPQKMRRAALYSALSEYMKDDKLMFIDSISIDSKRMTKSASDILKDLKLDKDKRVLVLMEDVDDNVKKAFSNIKNARILSSKFLNAYEVEYHNRVIFTEGAIKMIPGYKSV